MNAVIAPEDPERRKVRRMNGRYQLIDSATVLAMAIQTYAKAYMEIVDGLGLEGAPEVAQSFDRLTKAAEQTLDGIEKQFDRDLMREQKEQQQNG